MDVCRTVSIGNLEIIRTLPSHGYPLDEDFIRFPFLIEVARNARNLS